MRIGLVAGEASGDQLGAWLLQGLRQRLPGVRFEGIGGPRMRAEGLVSFHPMEKLSVHGYVEALRHYREIVGIRNSLKARWRRDPPDLFIGIDAPDFNLNLEAGLRRRGVPTVQYVGPAVWAWRAGRLRQIRESVSKVLLLFPFEAEIYRRAGIPAEFVGHPLARLLPPVAERVAIRERMRLPAAGPVVALLPGSRVSEVGALAQPFVEAARLIHRQLPDARFLAPLANRETRELFEQAYYRDGADPLPLTILYGHAHEALGAANAALVASGTATLEAALLGCPMVIAYRMAPLNWWLIRRKKILPYVGLPNILAQRFLVPELLQDDATPENLARALLNLLRDPVVPGRLVRIFADIRRQLTEGSEHRAAEAVLPLLARALRPVAEGAAA